MEQTADTGRGRRREQGGVSRENNTWHICIQFQNGPVAIERPGAHRCRGCSRTGRSWVCGACDGCGGDACCHPHPARRRRGVELAGRLRHQRHRPHPLTASHNMLPGGNTERLTSAMCDYWDNTQFTLAPGDYPGNGTSGDSGTEQRRPSNGEAVWLSGVWESFA